MKLGESSKRNVGYLALKPIYKNLKLNEICHALNSKYKTTADINEVFQFLIYSKIIDASSKLSSYMKKYQFFENYSFSEDQMYRCLTYIGKSYEQIKDYVFRTTEKSYGLDLSKSIMMELISILKLIMKQHFKEKVHQKKIEKNH